MATKRQRSNGKWEFIVKNKAMLKKPWTGTFETEAEGDDYCARLEAFLAAGIVPEELKPENRSVGPQFLSHVIRDYLSNASPTAADRDYLSTVQIEHGATQVKDVDKEWAQTWITALKRQRNLAPSTIKHLVGSLARCLDWAGQEAHVVQFIVNPLRLLPRKYSQYTPADAKAVRALGGKPKKDESRDRRLNGNEEVRIREVLAGKLPENRQRPLSLKHQGALELLFDLALETGMRLSEMFTLERSQVNIMQRTVYLTRTKNGTKRQVPLSTVAVKALDTYESQVSLGERGMQGYTYPGDRLFPWWNGAQEEDLEEPDKKEMKRVTALLSAQFGRIFDASGCPDLTFHDLRHEATSRFFERTTLSDQKIAKITGHKDPRMLARYANLRPSNLADQLW